MKQSTRSHLKSSAIVLLLSSLVFGFFYLTVLRDYENLPPGAKVALSNPYIYMWWR